MPDDQPIPAPTVRIASARVGPSGRTLFIALQDPDGAATALRSIAAHPSIRVGGGAPIALSGPIWGSASSYVLYPIASTIAPGTTLTIDAPASWATTAAGPAPAESGRAAIVDGSPFLPSSARAGRTLRVGTNLDGPSSAGSLMYYANARRQARRFLGADGRLDPAGYLLRDAVGGPWEARVNTTGDDPGPGSKPTRNAPSGLWTLKWDGPGLAILGVCKAGQSSTPIDESLTGASDNVRRYDVQAGPRQVAPDVRLIVDGPDARNVRIYPPGVDPNRSPKFRPDFVRMLAGTSCIRFANATRTDSSSAALFDHFSKQSAFSADVPAYRRRATIRSVSPDADADRYRGPDAVRARFATDAPHGFFEGQIVRVVAGPLAGPGGRGEVPLSGGGAVALDAFNGPVHILSSTEFTLPADGPDGATPDRTYAGNELRGGAPDAPTARTEAVGGMPVGDCIDLCNLIGADLGFNVPHAMTDQGVDDLSRFIAGRLRPGLLWRCEYSNEHFDTRHGQSKMFVGLGRMENISATAWYAGRAARVHALARAAFLVAGRPPTDVVRVMGSSADSNGPTVLIADHCRARGMTFDELAVAPPLDARGPDGEDRTAESTYRSLDIEQVMDVAEVSTLFGDYGRYVRPHRAALDARGFSGVAIVGTGGGPRSGFLGDPAASPPEYVASWSRKWVRHPRLRGLILGFLRRLQDLGMARFDHDRLDGPADVNRSAYPVHDMKADSAATPASSRNVDPENLARIVSVIGGALDAWSSTAVDGVKAVPSQPTMGLDPDDATPTPIPRSPRSRVPRLGVAAVSGVPPRRPAARIGP